MWRYSYNLRGLYETPTLPHHADAELKRGKAARILREARGQGRTLLTEFESKQLLAAYGIPTVETRIATTEDDAVRAAQEIGFPIVLKLHSLNPQNRRWRRITEPSRRRCGAESLPNN